MSPDDRLRVATAIVRGRTSGLRASASAFRGTTGRMKRSGPGRHTRRQGARFLLRPRIDDEVLVAFDHGDPVSIRRPYLNSTTGCPRDCRGGPPAAAPPTASLTFDKTGIARRWARNDQHRGRRGRITIEASSIAPKPHRSPSSPAAASS